MLEGEKSTASRAPQDFSRDL